MHPPSGQTKPVIRALLRCRESAADANRRKVFRLIQQKVFDRQSGRLYYTACFLYAIFLHEILHISP